MQKLLDAAQSVQNVLTEKNRDFCFIGGIALLRWGIPRLTQDVDLTLFTGFGREEFYIRELLDAFAPRITDAMDFAIEHRVVLLQTSGGIAVDITLAGFQFEEEMIRRSTMERFNDSIILRLCSAEDLVIQKVFAGRNKDWGDVESILQRQPLLDWSRIESTVGPLLEMKDDSESLQKLMDIRENK